MSSESELNELAKSYEDHMRSFEDALDARSPKRERRNTLSRSQGRDRSASGAQGRSPPVNVPAKAASRANSNPSEVIIGFAPPTARSESPEEKILSRSAEKKAGSLSRRSQEKVASPRKGAQNKGSQSKQAAGKASHDPRGPKVNKKNMTKAERRAQAQKEQELARSRRQGKGGGKGGGAAAPSLERHKTETPGAMELREKKKGGGSGGGNIKRASKAAAVAAPVRIAGAEDENRVHFLMHLPDYYGMIPNEPSVAHVHPEIIRLGTKYANGSIMGSSARCVALLAAFKCVVESFVLPVRTEFSKAFYEWLRPNIRYIIECRPQSVSMGNAIRSLKTKITACRGLSEAEGKKVLLEHLDEFLEERLLTAQQLICEFGLKKIVDGDVIVTYACSFVVSKLLLEAHEAGKKFRVIVVDANPLREGKSMLKRLATAGINCSYVLLNSVCYVMKEVTKVLVGAYALLSNGNLVSRVGTAVVTMVAHEYNKPVLVCSETIKFSEKAMLNSITWNELGDADVLAKVGDQPLQDWRSTKGLYLLSILYDVTPSQYVDVIVTEFGMIPPTSVPVILRESYGYDGIED